MSKLWVCLSVDLIVCYLALHWAALITFWCLNFPLPWMIWMWLIIIIIFSIKKMSELQKLPDIFYSKYICEAALIYIRMLGGSVQLGKFVGFWMPPPPYKGSYCHHAGGAWVGGFVKISHCLSFNLTWTKKRLLLKVFSLNRLWMLD